MFKNTISNAFGCITRIQFPKKIQTFINKKYINHFGIDMSNFKHHSEYKSLLELFTRRYVNFPNIEEGFISPCDGVVFGMGTSVDVDNKSKAFSIKGKEYFIDDVLLKKPFESFDFLNIYLSPKDYHNYHAPCDMQILSLSYIPADLYSVSYKALLKVPNLYAKNERVILECKSGEKVFFMVFVGALNVGKMVFDFDESVQTNAKNGSFYKEYKNLFVKKADMLGRFELGSTILIISKSNDIKYNLENGDSVKFGKQIADEL